MSCWTRLRAALGREFGEIRFWGFAVVRPSDRSWRLESVEREGSTLLLGLRDMAGPPLPALLSLDRPIGLTVSAHGLTFERAVRLGFTAILAGCGWPPLRPGHPAWHRPLRDPGPAGADAAGLRRIFLPGRQR